MTAMATYPRSDSVSRFIFLDCFGGTRRLLLHGPYMTFASRLSARDKSEEYIPSRQTIAYRRNNRANHSASNSQCQSSLGRTNTCDWT
ncbi:hypothetical protein M408DRAFT_291828 [Serendipita vermifera MAFF 305830]|uniref:Uncharacterized protein n=1 Tax=Serendipita vermifera MAFF 305830 TaxID=933852 RepID=A0A0C2WYA4_SERVB|nr:hypothetical protein M408DRAFT_291828 [Serendipita vermifera MAFF 305830]